MVFSQSGFMARYPVEDQDISYHILFNLLSLQCGEEQLNYEKFTQAIFIYFYVI